MHAYPHQLSGRPAAARRHRHGAAVEPAPPDPRRADDRARRDGRGRHRRAGQGPRPPAVGTSLAVHLAQSRPDPRDLRSVTVMYSGEAVETGRVRDVFDAVRHPYTQGLFRSIPLPGANKNDNPLIPIPGQLPLPHERPQGCNFGPRCTHFVAGRCDRGRCADARCRGPPGPSEPLPAGSRRSTGRPRRGRPNDSSRSASAPTCSRSTG